MTRHSSYPADRSEEVSVVSNGEGPKKAAWSKAGARLSPVVTQEESPSLIVEERQDTAESVSSPSVRAIKQKFENAAANREEGRRQSVACGSPLAERKKMLQQSLSLPREDVPEESEDVIQTSQSSKEEDKPETKQFQRYRRGQTVAANRRHRQQATRIVERLKLFEKRESFMSQEDATTMSAPTTFDIPVPILEAPAPGQERSLAIPASESEQSTLDYSFFSDESLNVRDEVEAFSRVLVSDSRERELLGTFQSEDDREVDAFVANLSPKNRYQGVLHDIVTKYEKDTNSTQGPSDDGSPEDAVTQEEKPFFGSTRISVLEKWEARRAEEASPISMLTSFETEDQTKVGVISKGGLQEPHEQDDFQVPFDEPPSEDNQWNSDATEPYEKQQSGDGSPPNSSHFSTVEQENEREEASETWGESFFADFNDRRTPSEGTDCFDTTDHQERQESGGNKKRNDTTVNLPRNYSLFNTLEQEDDRESNDDITGGATDSDGVGEKGSEVIKQKAQVGSAKIETTTGETYAGGVGSATATSRRFEIVSESEQPPIKGILKNKMDPRPPSAYVTPTSPASSASWYDSSGTSIGTSEISPLQSRELAMPILPSSRFSIGACVNAHLTENQAEGASEVSSQCSSHQPRQNESRWPHKQERRDSESSSIVPRNPRAQTMSLNSMDAQYSTSSHRGRHETRQDFDEMAQSMTTMARTASTVVLDVFVEAADKVVVAPLLSIFNCVDQSESIFCQGASVEDYWGTTAMSQTVARGVAIDQTTRIRSSRRKHHKKKERKSSRKFKA